MKYLSIILSFLFMTVAFAQEERTLQQTLEALSQDAARSYLTPIASGFGANLNAGWFHRAPQPEKFGFDIELGFVGMGAQFPKNADHFSTSGEFQFSQSEARSILEKSTDFNSLPIQIQNGLVQSLTEQTLNVSMEGGTIIGAKDDRITVAYGDLTVTDPNTGQTLNLQGDSEELEIGGILDRAEFIPLMAPQFSIGTIYGTVATFRYLPSVILNEDLGEFSYFGFGLQHNPTAWLPVKLPLDISAGFFAQSMEIGDLFSTTAVAFGLNASKQFGYEALNVTPYAGFMIESSTMVVTYDFIVNTPAGPNIQKINFEIDGENVTRLTMGLSIRFLIINLNADYNIGQYNNFSLGINFAI